MRTVMILKGIRLGLFVICKDDYLIQIVDFTRVVKTLPPFISISFLYYSIYICK